MHHVSAEMKSCIEDCLACYGECLSTAMGHCLQAGGEHTSPPHFKLIMACSEICRTAAHFMLIGSQHHRHVCRECADDCERIGDMRDCVKACRRCADSCHRMAS